MNTQYANRRITTKVTAARLIAALSIAAALLASGSVFPDDASAVRTSDRKAARACGAAGGHVSYDFYDGSFRNFDMVCTFPGGSFVCVSQPGPFGGIVDCF